MRRFLILITLLCCTSENAHAQLADYVYPYFDQPSYSNYGTVGLIQMPSARMHKGGTIGFTWSHLEPYLRGSVMGNPFDWFEASYQYTDVNNKLYSDVREFSGSRLIKTKASMLLGF